MLPSRKSQQRENTFWKSIGVVLGGTVVAQSIPLLGSLVIARLYSPADFGVFSAWLGMLLLAGVVITGRFEMALAVEPDGAPRRLAMAATLATIVLASGILAALVMLIYLGSSALHGVSPLLVFLFVPATLLTGVIHTWQSWAAAEGNYRGLSWIRIAQALIITSAQIGMGLAEPSAFGMALGHVLGLLVGVFFSATLMPLNPLPLHEVGQLWTTLKFFWRSQRRFPLLALPADTINAAAGQLPLLLIAGKFGAEAGGLFALALRVLGAPIGLLGTAVLDVFKRTASSSYREKGNCRDDYLRIFRLLAVGGATLAVGAFFLAESVFVVAFGEPWRKAGTLAVWLMPMFAMRFVASPLSYVFYIAGKQQVDLGWQCALLAMTVAAFTFPVDFETAVTLYAAGYGGLYVVYTALSYHYSKGAAK
ncbi:MAG: oligosaccharide flippase family protein [Burkholderiaceae bacterium]|uniref:oligosaccharide flippase family protein n=1 Tax=Polaromonas sp. YR568 TaxID=1855301 RepID=UPI0027205A57|nr:oligosaccharide flippase family protein [Burkholderiaceae bacterium]MDO9316919.1 oligosaccharide flippase family protein [Gammaproteobacteria bacterium]